MELCMNPKLKRLAPEVSAQSLNVCDAMVTSFGSVHCRRCPVVVQDVELYMNQKVQRLAPEVSAQFLGTMVVGEGEEG